MSGTMRETKDQNCIWLIGWQPWLHYCTIVRISKELSTLAPLCYIDSRLSIDIHRGNLSNYSGCNWV